MSVSHVRERPPRRGGSQYYRASAPEQHTLCGAPVTDRDLALSDVLRARKPTKNLGAVQCLDCRQIVHWKTQPVGERTT